jgi:hypothetical protein
MKSIISILLLLVSLQLSGQNKTKDFLSGKGYGNNTFAIIVANEDYQSYSDVYVENEELAINQAERFQQFLIKNLGVPNENISFFPDAVNTHIKLAITKLQRKLPLNSRLIFYYRGKSYADTVSGDLFLVPVDVSDNETFFMLGLNDLCKRLKTINNNGVDIFIDCLPGIKSGIRSILENGFEKGKVPLTEVNKMEIFSLSAPQALTLEKPSMPSNARPPEITITEPTLKVVETKELSAVIQGKVKSDCNIEVISVNGQEAPSLPDGSFIARVNLTEGENKIAVEVKNCAGWSRDYFTFITPVAPQEEEKGEQAVSADTGAINIAGKNFAVIIGISKYRDPLMPDLFYPIKDAMKVKEVLLANYTFDTKNVFLLENATREKIVKTLDSLSRIITSDDNLLIFYAGHGTWDEKTNMGYWMPSDASAQANDNWLMNSIITSYASQCNAKHTLVIADACFGGSIFRTRAFKSEEEKTNSELYNKMSKKAMTSGDLTEVPDQSVFVQNFILYLTENKDDYLSSEKLFFNIKTKVVDAIDLIPQFGIIKNAGDQGGDYIFFKKQ